MPDPRDDLRVKRIATLSGLLVSAEIALRRHEGDKHEDRAEDAVDALKAAIEALAREKHIDETKAALADAEKAIDRVYCAMQRAVTGEENP